MPPGSRYAAPAVRAIRALRRLGSSRRGSAAIEFAILALPFVFMIMAILELALVFMVNISLDNATAIEARKFRTGQECFNTASSATVASGVAALKHNICNNMSWLQAQCTNNLYVDMRTFSSFSGASTPAPTTTNAKTGQTGFDSSQIQDASGGAGSVNIMTTYYMWPLLTPFLYGGLQSFPGTGQHMLVSTEVMVLEPFGSCTQFLGSGA